MAGLGHSLRETGEREPVGVGVLPTTGRDLVETWEKSEPGPPRLLPKEGCLMGRNGKDASSQPFPVRPLQAHSPSPTHLDMEAFMARAG